MKKSVSIIGSTGIPARYGGFETLAEQLSTHLSAKYNILVFCTTTKYNKSERQLQWNGINRYFLPLKANGVQSILYDLISLIIACRKSEIVVILGGSASFFLPIFAFMYKKKKLIFHPDGQEWNREKWKSFSSSYLQKSIRIGCKAANHIIIDNEALKPTYNKYRHKLFSCSYGGDQYKIDYTKTEVQTNYWLTIARAEPENKLALIAQVFSTMPEHHWYLISNFTKTKFGRKLYMQFKGFRNIHFIKSTFSAQEIESHYKKCSGYIHGHSAGGSNPTLVAAMFLNKPLICNDNKFNRETTKGKALFFTNEDELKTLISQNNFSSETAAEALNLAQQEYTWSKIAHKYQLLFEE